MNRHYVIDGKPYFLAGHDGVKGVYFFVEKFRQQNSITEVPFDFDGIIYASDVPLLSSYKKLPKTLKELPKEYGNLIRELSKR